MIKKILHKILFFAYNNQQKINHLQGVARDKEWDNIWPLIMDKSSVLDIGCGTGYYVKKASDHGLRAVGVERELGKFGVTFDSQQDVKIIEGSAENLPIKDEKFDVILFTHVLQYITDYSSVFKEISRVSHQDTIIIIGVPCSQMVWLGLFTQWLFTTHTKIFNILFGKIFNTGSSRLLDLFIPVSSVRPDLTLFHDLSAFRKSAWKKLICRHLYINQINAPFFYMYPDYIQLFKGYHSRIFTSSYYFICSSKSDKQ